MGNELYKNIGLYRKSDVEIAREEVTRNITKTFCDIFKLNNLYHLGVIAMLNTIIKGSDKHSYTRKELIEYMKAYGEDKEIQVDDDIKTLINKCIAEYER